jgi:hypothetical protein
MINYSISQLTVRQTVIVVDGFKSVFLPPDCYVASSVKSESGNISCFLVYQRDNIIHGASNYFGLLSLCLQNVPIYGFHLGRLELELREKRSIVSEITSITEDLKIDLEMAYEHLDDLGCVKIDYKSERWQLFVSQTAALVESGRDLPRREIGG